MIAYNNIKGGLAPFIVLLLTERLLEFQVHWRVDSTAKHTTFNTITAFVELKKRYEINYPFSHL